MLVAIVIVVAVMQAVLPVVPVIVAVLAIPVLPAVVAVAVAGLAVLALLPVEVQRQAVAIIRAPADDPKLRVAVLDLADGLVELFVQVALGLRQPAAQLGQDGSVG